MAAKEAVSFILSKIEINSRPLSDFSPKEKAEMMEVLGHKIDFPIAELDERLISAVIERAKKELSEGNTSVVDGGSEFRVRDEVAAKKQAQDFLSELESL